MCKIRHLFHPHGLSNSPGLRDILYRHAGTIKHFEVVPIPSILHTDISFAWMTNHLADEQLLTNLETLEIMPPMLNLQGLNLVVACIKRSAETLTSLSLHNHVFWDLDQVRSVVSVFSHRRAEGLTSLSIYVRILSPTLVDTLASGLTCLKKLRLHFDRVEFAGDSYRDQDPDQAAALLII